MARGRGRAPAPTAGDAGRDVTDLVEELNDAAYWTEDLVLAADLVAFGVVNADSSVKGMADSTVLQFLLEEAKVASVRVAEVSDDLADRLGVRP